MGLLEPYKIICRRIPTWKIWKPKKKFYVFRFMSFIKKCDVEISADLWDNLTSDDKQVVLDKEFEHFCAKLSMFGYRYNS